MKTLRRRFKQKITAVGGKEKYIEQQKKQEEKAPKKRQEEELRLSKEAEEWLAVEGD